MTRFRDRFHYLTRPAAEITRLLLTHAKAAATFLTHSRQRRRARRIQRDFLDAERLDIKARVVMFVCLPSRKVTGGGLQINTLYRESRRLFKHSDAAAILCWPPGRGRDLHQDPNMPAVTAISPFWTVIDRCPKDCALTLHLPEFAAQSIINDRIGWRWIRENAQGRELHINILNQNYDVMVPIRLIRKLGDIGVKTTITTGASQWASPNEQLRYGVPIHWIPTWYYTDAAEWQPYSTKKNLLIVSPDPSPHRQRVLDAIRRGMPELDVRVISGISFDQYTELEKTAKWSLTFGEGCDGYFYGPALRGGVPFAVYNGTFANWDPDDWRTTYNSYDELASCIVGDMKALDNQEGYEKYSLRLREHFSKYRGYDALIDQVERFYRGDYRWHPSHDESLADDHHRSQKAGV